MDAEVTASPESPTQSIVQIDYRGEKGDRLERFLFYSWMIAYLLRHGAGEDVSCLAPLFLLPFSFEEDALRPARRRVELAAAAHLVWCV